MLNKEKYLSDILAHTIFYYIKKVQVHLMENFSYHTIFYSFLQNQILNTNFYVLHPSHLRDAYTGDKSSEELFQFST